MRMTTTICCGLLPLFALPAQKLPLAGDPEHVVTVHAIASALDRCLEHAGRSLRGDFAEPAAIRANCRDELLRAIRAFVEPPLGEREHVVALGPDHLVALVRPQQAAWIERFFQRLDALDLGQRLDGRFDRVTLPVARAAELLSLPEPPGLTGAIALPLTKEQVRALRREPDKVDGPTSWRFPHATWMIFGSGMPFVKGWRKVPLRSSDDDLVAPEIGKVHDGCEFELQYVPLPDGGIGWAMRADVAIVDWDSPTATVQVGGVDYVTDAPAVRAATIDATLTMAKPAAFAFGHRLGDDVMLLVFEPKP